AEVRHELQSASGALKVRITTQMEARVLPLLRMAKRWEYWGQPPRDDWESDAGLYVRHYAGFRGVAWVDPALRVRWIVPLRGNEGAQNLDLGLNPERLRSLQRAPRGP